MADSVLSACLAEFQQALAALEPEVTGLEEQRLLPNADVTQAALDAQIALFTTRQGLLDAALTALRALQADGYPVLPTYDVPAEVYAELQHNAEEVLAALDHFRQIARLHLPKDVSVDVHSSEPAV